VGTQQKGIIAPSTAATLLPVSPALFSMHGRVNNKASSGELATTTRDGGLQEICNSGFLATGKGHA
jgi:hypothetical protein